MVAGGAVAQGALRAPQALSGIPEAAGASIANRAGAETTGASTVSPSNGEPKALAGMLGAQNAARVRLGLPELTWSAELAARAGETVKIIATPQTCSKTGVIRGGETAGAAVYWSAGLRMFSGGNSQQEISSSFVVSEWLGASADYDKVTGQCERTGACQSFARLANPVARTVGCAKAVCDGQAQVWACHYGQ